MKRTIRLIGSTALATWLAVETACAGVLLTNRIENIQGMGVGIYPLGGENPTYTQRYPKANTRNNTTGDKGKAWIQFNLADAWTFYGQTNLVSARL